MAEVSGRRISSEAGAGLASRVAELDTLGRVVNELCEIARRTGIERTFAIGELILTRFFEGDASRWRDRRRNKNNSVRRLAEREDCPFSKSALNEAIAVHVAVLGLPCVRTFGHISASHVASVLRVSPEARQSILEVADRERWSVRELKQRVVAFRREQGERRGRPARNDESRVISRMQTASGSIDEGAEQVSHFQTLTPEAVSSLRTLGSELTQLGARLSRIASGEPDLARTRSHSELQLRERSA
jgi:hypothetical protein